jgi:hypothetical protein
MGEGRGGACGERVSRKCSRLLREPGNDPSAVHVSTQAEHAAERANHIHCRTNSSSTAARFRASSSCMAFSCSSCAAFFSCRRREASSMALAAFTRRASSSSAAFASAALAATHRHTATHTHVLLSTQAFAAHKARVSTAYSTSCQANPLRSQYGNGAHVVCVRVRCVCGGGGGWGGEK